MTPERLEEIRKRRDQALGMVSSLCKPRGTEGIREWIEWIISIPARPDHDPDLVIGAALKDIDALLAHIDAQAEEIERLLRDRDSVVDIAAAALDHVRKRYNGYSDSLGNIEEALLDVGFTIDDLDGIPGLGQAREDVLALLNSTTSHTTTYRQINNQPDSWECTKCVHALVDGMSPSEHNASYCPGCGRRIIGEEPWRDDEGSGQS